MKLYDFVRAWVNDADYDIEGPVVVLTLNELREMWDAAEHRRRDVITVERSGEQKAILSPDFTTYITSKGINITENGK